MINKVSNNDLSEEELDYQNSFKEYLSCKYFDNIKIKNLRKMNFKTPGGHDCTGYISKKANYQLGSMVITNVDGVETEQYVQGMPKIQYYDLSNVNVYEDISVREKIDGTNICIFLLLDPLDDGNVLEVLSKTRNMPILTNDFMEKFKLIDTSRISDFLINNRNVGSLCFELYGIENLHDIRYDNQIGLKLLTGFYNNGEQLSNILLEEVSKSIGIKLPDVLFYYNYLPHSKRYIVTATIEAKTKFNPILDITNLKSYIKQNCINPEEAFYLMSEILESVNKANISKGEGNLVEGVIITTNTDNGVIQLKNKPKSIRENHTCSEGIPTKAINHELYKFFDEYGKLEATRIIKEEPEKVKDYIHSGLSEEFSDDKISMKKSQARIETALHKRLYGDNISEMFLNIAEEYVTQYPDKSSPDLMRIFSIDYPDLRNKSNLMFNAFEKVKMENKI